MRNAAPSLPWPTFLTYRFARLSLGPALGAERFRVSGRGLPGTAHLSIPAWYGQIEQFRQSRLRELGS
jgi:hypothetical protein